MKRSSVVSSCSRRRAAVCAAGALVLGVGLAVAGVFGLSLWGGDEAVWPQTVREARLFPADDAGMRREAARILGALETAAGN